LTYWACSVYQINPDCDRTYITDIFSNENEEHMFGSHEGDPMSIYIDRVVQNSWGSYIDAALDILSKPFPSRRRPSRRIVTTIELNIQIFNRDRLRDFVIIYAAHGNAGNFRTALRPLYSSYTGEDKNILLTLSFNLRRKYEYLTSRFPGMEEFAAIQIRNDHVKKARVGGIDLEESPQFYNWVLDTDQSGRLTSMGLNIGRCTLKIKPNGSMYSSNDYRPVAPVVYLLEALLDCGGIVLQTDIGAIISNT